MECEKLVRRLEFEKAIEVSDPPSAFEGLDLDSMVVDDSYDGARLGQAMTQDFIDDMIKRFRDGKKIHKKYAFQIVQAVRDIIYDEPTLVEIGVEKDEKLTVCGDTHGNAPMCSCFLSRLVYHWLLTLPFFFKDNSSTFSRSLD